MAKKPKASKTKPKNSSASDSASSDIFNNIFGGGSIVPQDNGSVSIFSDTNPFRRQSIHLLKPTQQPDSSGGLVSRDDDDDDDVELKKKRKKEKKQSFESGSAEEDSKALSEGKKSKKKKKVKVKNQDLGIESDEEGDRITPKSESGSEKKKTSKTPNSSSELKVEDKKGKDVDLGIESNGMSKKEEGKELAWNLETNKREGGSKRKKEKQKKRKRDELETEYEVKHYGAAGELEIGVGGVAGTVVGEKRKKLDNPAEMLVSKEGFDDESKLLRTVFVGNLPLKVKKKALMKEFSQFGEIESVRIRSVPLMDTKTPRKGAIMKKQINDSVDNVHAYIVFRTEQSAQASLAHNMAVVEGNHLRVDRACPPRKKLKEDNVTAPLYDNKRTVFVGNLPFDVKDEELYQLFCGIKELELSIEAVRVVRHSDTSVGKGIAYVLFKTRDAANLVVKTRNLKLRDRELRLCHTKSDSTPSKRKNPSAAQTDNPPPKKVAGNSRTPSRSDSRVKTNSATSYQGLRASKSGVQKKIRSKTTEPMKLISQTQKGEMRQTKRPAVAARKAALNGGSASKQAGKKRKLETRTPESSRRNKKAKKFR